MQYIRFDKTLRVLYSQRHEFFTHNEFNWHAVLKFMINSYKVSRWDIKN